MTIIRNILLYFCTWV